MDDDYSVSKFIRWGAMPIGRLVIQRIKENSSREAIALLDNSFALERKKERNLLDGNKFL